MRSNTPVTLTHHTTPPPYYCHTHSVHTSIPNAQVSRAGLLVWYGGAAAIRGGQACGGSHSAGCAVHPTGTPVQPTSSTTSAQLSLRFSSRTYNRQLIMTSSYLFRLRTDNIRSQDQDSQFSLLPTTSVARGEKSSALSNNILSRSYPIFKYV